MTNVQLKKRIMRRVYVLFFFRKATGPTAFKIYTLLLSSAGIVSLVSIQNVLSNMPQGSVAEAFNYAFYALTHTEFAVQLFVAATFAAAFWLARDIVQGASHPRLNLKKA